MVCFFCCLTETAIYKPVFQVLRLPLELPSSVLGHHLPNKEYTREAVMDTFILKIFTRTNCLALQEYQPGRACLSEEVQVTRQALQGKLGNRWSRIPIKCDLE